MISKGIEPRVGMQFVFPPFNGRRRRISGLTHSGDIICTVHAGCLGDCVCMCTSLELWNNGAYEIEWVPPTDEEREMFRNVYDSEAFWQFWQWYIHESGHRYPGVLREIAESLAMDGL